MPTVLEHVGIAVRDPDAFARLLREVLALHRYAVETVEDQGVRTHFVPAGGTKVELLESISDDSPVARHLERRGEGLHHLAFEVEDVDAAMDRVRRLGLTPLSPAPAPGADGKRIFFIHPRDTHGVLVELCQQAGAPLPAMRVPFRDAHLAAYVMGREDAPPLLVLHGAAGATAMETGPLARLLAQHYRVVALDFTGHGASPDLGEPFTIGLFVDNVTAVANHLGIDRFHVFGSSMGGAVAVQAALAHPDRVARLAVHGTCISWTPELVARMTARLDAKDLARRFPEAADAMARIHGDWECVLERTDAFVRTLPDQWRAEAPLLGAVQAPALVSTFDRDPLFPLDIALDLHRRLPHARLAVLPGSKHGLPNTTRGTLAALIRCHLAQQA